MKQARKPRSYASPKLCPLTHSLTYLLTGVKCRATSVAKNWYSGQFSMIYLTIFFNYNNINHIGHSHFVLTWFGKCVCPWQAYILGNIWLAKTYILSLTSIYFGKYMVSKNIFTTIIIYEKKYNLTFSQNNCNIFPRCRHALKNWRIEGSWPWGSVGVLFGHSGCNSCNFCK